MLQICSNNASAHQRDWQGGGGRSDAETGIVVKSEKKAESFETTNCR